MSTSINLRFPFSKIFLKIDDNDKSNNDIYPTTTTI